MKSPGAWLEIQAGKRLFTPPGREAIPGRANAAAHRGQWRAVSSVRAAFAAACLGLAALQAHPAPGLPAAPEVLMRHHYAGAAAADAMPGGTTFKEVARMPETGRLLGRIAAKNVPAIEAFLRSNRREADAVGPAGLLLEDLIRAESLSEWRRLADGSQEVFLAIRLPRERAEVWDTALADLARDRGAENRRDIEEEGFRGWEATAGKLRFRVLRAGEWMLLGCGTGPLDLQREAAVRVSASLRPGPAMDSHWLRFEADSTWLQSRLGMRGLALKPSRIELSMSGRDEYVRSEARVIFREPHGWKAEGWQPPVRMIRDPLVSFTAARNLAAILDGPDLLRDVPVQPLASQFFVWAQPVKEDVPVTYVLTYAALKVNNVARTLEVLATNLPALFNAGLEQRRHGKILWDAEKEEIRWRDLTLPILQPYLRAAPPAAGEFLLAGFWHLSSGGTPAPDELFEQIRPRDNLIFYQWEITQTRLAQWRMLSILLPMFPVSLPGPDPRGPGLRPDKTGQEWINAVMPKLGNTVTEMTVTSPTEVHAVRRSHLGLTGLEIVTLVHWLAGYEKSPVPPRQQPPTAPDGSSLPDDSAGRSR